jgi:hypothetical protein
MNGRHGKPNFSGHQLKNTNLMGISVYIDGR